MSELWVQSQCPPLQPPGVLIPLLSSLVTPPLHKIQNLINAPLLGNVMNASESSKPTSMPASQPINFKHHSIENIKTPQMSNIQGVVNKRHSPDNLVAFKGENAPLNIQVKRQRTKSGCDQMEALVPCLDSGLLNGDTCSKGESTPLCERNVRTQRLEGVLDVGSSPSLDTSFQYPIRGLESASESVMECRNNLFNGCTIESVKSPPLVTEIARHTRCSIAELITMKEDVAGGMSPHCAATLEYATQLPEGCSGGVGNQSAIDAVTHRDSDDELEDDDNYLDSSDEEEEEESTVGGLDDEESCGEDDQSIISSITVGSTCSLRSVASERLATVCINEHGVAANEDGSLVYTDGPAVAPLAALSPSLFSHVPPSINFCQYNESTEELPAVIARLLKWRFTNITPLIVRKTIINSGFKITKKTLQWCGTWGKHMKSPCFKTIKDFQKINHFPGTFQIGRKDKLWKNFSRLQSKFGKEEFGFIPKTFVLPGDLKSLEAAFEKEGVKKKWIVKPPASARGTGIQVVHKWSQIPKDGPVVVQRYISRPYLINDTKFDIRLYVLVTSFNPLRIYLYQDGLARFASVQYNSASKSLSDRYIHLTNYSVNKTSQSYTHNSDAGQCQGHKWTLRALWGYLKTQGVDTGALWSRIADVVVKTIVSCEHDIVIRARKNIRSRYSCYELFGFDVILDEKLRPWLLEVNISPSLHSASPLDHSVKGPLIADLLNMAAFHLPDKLTQHQQVALLKEFTYLDDRVSGLCLDRRLYTRLCTVEEVGKHVLINGQPREKYLIDVLENITSDDMRHLIVAEDELQRAGKFTCIFPTPDTHSYFGFMDKPRYYNRLMDAWENTYMNCRDKGIERLEVLCKEKTHLKVPQQFRLPKVTGSRSSGQVSKVRQPSFHPLGFSSLQQKSSLTALNHSLQVCSQEKNFDEKQVVAELSKLTVHSGSKDQEIDLIKESNVSQGQKIDMSKEFDKEIIDLGIESKLKVLKSTALVRVKTTKTRSPRVIVNPLKPAIVKHFMAVRGVVGGRGKPVCLNQDKVAVCDKNC